MRGYTATDFTRIPISDIRWGLLWADMASLRCIVGLERCAKVEASLDLTARPPKNSGFIMNGRIFIRRIMTGKPFRLGGILATATSVLATYLIVTTLSLSESHLNLRKIAHEETVARVLQEASVSSVIVSMATYI